MERPQQGYVTQRTLNASRGVTAYAGRPQVNKQQDDMVDDAPPNSLNPLGMSRDGARRVQGNNFLPEVSAASSPKAISAYTKHLQQQIHSSICGPQPGPAMLEFCSSLEHLYSAVAPQMNAVNISTILCTLAHEWVAAQLNPNFRHDEVNVSAKVKAVFQQSIQQLQPKMQGMRARAISNIVWSSAKLGFDPDEYVPGMVHTLIYRFQQLVQAASAKQHPNAQEAANIIWALATMHHTAATSELLDCVCSHFGSLVQHPDARQRPTAQSVANVAWALAELQHSPKDDRLLDDFCLYMHSLLQSQDARARPNAQAIANLFRALAVLKHPPKDGRFLDDFCRYMQTLLQSQDGQARPTAQSIANTLWSLARMKHAPPSEVVSAMLDHLVALCQIPGLQPSPQEISNCFLACAQLGLYMHQSQVEVLFRHLLKLHVSKVRYQGYSNVAWGLAVMGHLEISMMDALLHQLTTKSNMLQEEDGNEGTSAELDVEAARQLHQVLEWLEPPQGSDQMEAWSSLHTKLQAFAPAPPHILHFSGHTELRDALAALGLLYKPVMPCGLYQTDAVLSRPGSNGPQVILMLRRSKYFIQNRRNRLLGPVAFRLKVLARYGTVVTVPYQSGRSSVESMAGAMKAAVEAKTGLPLHSFRC